MWDFLEKLRAMPDEARKTVALFSSLGITALILVSWFVFPVPHFGSLSAEERERKPAEDLLAPFSLIGQEIGVATNGIKDSWSSVSGVTAAIKSQMVVPDGTASSSFATTSEEVVILPEEETPVEPSATTTNESVFQDPE